MPKRIDLTGKRFGRLTVLKYCLNIQRWMCLCDCGKEKNIIAENLKNGTTTSCGCYSKEYTSLHLRAKLEGQKFGKLTVLKFSHINPHRHTVWICLCECGKETIVVGSSLKSGNTTSCGCYNRGKIIRTKIAKQCRTPKNGNSLAEKFPEIAKEWHPTKNNNTPNNVRFSCHDIVWWLGRCGYEWQSQISNRTHRYYDLDGCGCPMCNTSKGEKKVVKALDKYHIKYEREKVFPNLRGIGQGLLRFDFYLSDYNILIEYQGEQHYNNTIWYNEKAKQITQQHDKIKKKYCKDNNIQLIEIPYTDFNKIEQIIHDIRTRPSVEGVV